MEPPTTFERHRRERRRTALSRRCTSPLGRAVTASFNVEVPSLASRIGRFVGGRSVRPLPASWNRFRSREWASPMTERRHTPASFNERSSGGTPVVRASESESTLESPSSGPTRPSPTDRQSRPASSLVGSSTWYHRDEPTGPGPSWLVVQDELAWRRLEVVRIAIGNPHNVDLPRVVRSDSALGRVDGLPHIEVHPVCLTVLGSSLDTIPTSPPRVSTTFSRSSVPAAVMVLLSDCPPAARRRRRWTQATCRVPRGGRVRRRGGPAYAPSVGYPVRNSSVADESTVGWNVDVG